VKSEIKETIYFGNNHGGVFTVSTKAKGITINKCSGITIIFSENIVGNLEIANSSKLTIQIAADAPIIQIDATERTSILINLVCAKKIQIFSAKSSSNVVQIPKGEDGDYIEFPLPEQIRTEFPLGAGITSSVAAKD